MAGWERSHIVIGLLNLRFEGSSQNGRLSSYWVRTKRKSRTHIPTCYTTPFLCQARHITYLFFRLISTGAHPDDTQNIIFLLLTYNVFGSQGVARGA